MLFVWGVNKALLFLLMRWKMKPYVNSHYQVINQSELLRGLTESCS